MKIVRDKKVADKLVGRLSSYIREFENGGVKFEKIFNNDKIKYDCYGNNFYCFKMRSNSHNTYRMLYKFNRNGDGFNIIPHIIVLKQDSQKYDGKEYIKYFTNYVNKTKER